MPSHGWFDVVEFPGGITMIAEPGHYEDVKSFLVEGERDVAVIDTGMGVGDFAGLVRSLSGKDPLVIQTHAHFDHIGASAEFERVLVHESEADDLRATYPNERFRRWFEPRYLGDIPLPDGFDPTTAEIAGTEPTGFLEHGMTIDLGGRELEIYHTPGHSPGGISIFDRQTAALFPGDAVYLGPMFAHNDYGDPQAYRESLRLLADLAGRASTVYPSHNQAPISPDMVQAMYAAYEEILAGRAPDDSNADRDVFSFDGYSFWMPPGWHRQRSEIR